MSKNTLTIFWISSLVLVFRLLVSMLPSFEYDQSAFRFWSIKLAEIGPINFYSSDFFTSNPVGFFYILWLVGSSITIFAPEILSNKALFDVFLKLPSNLADVVTGLIIYYFVRKRNGPKWGLAGFLLYTLNPGIFFNSSIWGQYDGIATLFLVLSTLSISLKKMPEVALVSLAVALTLKPQTIAVLPIMLFLLILYFEKLRWISSLLVFIGSLLVIYLPFFPKNPLEGLLSVNLGSAGLFNCTTCFAINFWGIFGNWQSDLNLFFGVPLVTWGAVLYLFVLVIVLSIRPFKLRLSSPNLYLILALAILTFFTFLTRMHERYLFPFFAFLLIGTLLIKSRLLIIFYLIFSLLHLINLYIPYTYYNKYPNDVLSKFLQNSFSFLSLIFLITALLTIFIVLKTLKKNVKIERNE